ncbi:MAG: EF-hand domain-containing protein [Thermoguttaceae bacterium]
MRSTLRIVFFGLCVAMAALSSYAQPPEDASRGSPERSAKSKPPNTVAVDAIVARMMAFDKNHDGKLTRDEITDPRLERLFDRADANHDGVVTKEELTALAQKMVAESSSGRGGRRGPGGPGGGFGPGPGRPDGGFFGGQSGGRGRGPRPPPPDEEDPSKDNGPPNGNGQR